MFLGAQYPRLDDKNRLILPAKFRDELSEGLVLTKGQDRCLVVWPKAAFDEYAEALRAGSRTDQGVRRYTRILFASAYDDAPDRQGRITLPSALREYAGIERDCVVIGQDRTLEIWDAAAWEQYEAANQDAFAELDGEVVPLS